MLERKSLPVTLPLCLAELLGLLNDPTAHVWCLTRGFQRQLDPVLVPTGPESCWPPCWESIRFDLPHHCQMGLILQARRLHPTCLPLKMNQEPWQSLSPCFAAIFNPSLELISFLVPGYFLS